MVSVANFRQLNFTAVANIEGVGDVELSYVKLSYGAGEVTSAYMELCIGIPVSGRAANPQVTQEQANAIQEDALVTISIFAEEQNGLLDGLPNGVIFTGYITRIGSSVSAELSSGLGFGIEVQHKAILDLNTGATATFPYAASGLLDYNLPVQRDNALSANPYITESSQITAANINENGVFELIRQFFLTIAEGTGGSAILSQIANTPGCAGEQGANAVAIEALNAIVGDPLRLQGNATLELLAYLQGKLGVEFRLMSFHQQLLALGQALFFRLIPHADGTLESVPFRTFSRPFKTLTADQVFNYTPSLKNMRRVGGVVMIGPAVAPRSAVRAPEPVIGCYTFPDRTPRGIIQVLPMPTYMSAALFQKPAQQKASLSAAASALNPDVGAYDAARGDVAEDVNEAANSQIVEPFGNALAREYARMLRYEASAASFTSYLRSDIAPLSTIGFEAPSTVGSNAEIRTFYGRVSTVTLELNAEDKRAFTQFQVLYVRDQNVQEQIQEEGFDHVFYDSAWTGSAI